LKNKKQQGDVGDHISFYFLKKQGLKRRKPWNTNKNTFKGGGF